MRGHAAEFGAVVAKGSEAENQSAAERVARKERLAAYL